MRINLILSMLARPGSMREHSGRGYRIVDCGQSISYESVGLLEKPGTITAEPSSSAAAELEFLAGLELGRCALNHARQRPRPPVVGQFDSASGSR